MFKVVMMLRKRPDLTRAEFMDYYTNHHVPFMHRLLPMGAAVHRRNFVVAPDWAEGDYDVISEVMYEDEATAAAAFAAYADPEIRRLAEEDEQRFLSPDGVKRYVVEVHETVFRALPGH